MPRGGCFSITPRWTGQRQLVPAFVGRASWDTSWSETMLLALRSHFFEFVAEEVGDDVADPREIPVIPLRTDGEADTVGRLQAFRRIQEITPAGVLYAGTDGCQPCKRKTTQIRFVAQCREILAEVIEVEVLLPFLNSTTSDSLCRVNE